MPDLGTLANYGVAGVMLAFFVWLHVQALKSGKEERKQMRADAEADRAKCQAENQALVQRVQVLENRSHEVQTEVIRSCMRVHETNATVMQANAEAFRRLTDSGGHATQH